MDNNEWIMIIMMIIMIMMDNNEWIIMDIMTDKMSMMDIIAYYSKMSMMDVFF